jgi:hypothetical protein
LTRPGSYDYDIAVLSDFRYPGGTSVSLAEEIKAQAAGGYTTALVPTRSPHLTRKRRFHSQIISCVQAGMGEMVAPDQELRVRALVVRHPAIFTMDPAPAPRVDADVIVMVVNQTPAGNSLPGAGAYYEVGLAEIRDRVNELFGGEAIWAPIGPVVREALLQTGVPLKMAESDWHNVLDVEEWRADRTAYVSDRPVIGRHARPHWKKWPESPADILAAYPDDEGVEVKVLGGGEVAEKILGQVPRNWVLYPFNSIAPQEFLRAIDFGVYFYHPEFSEAFGRTIAESLASGSPTIVRHDLSALFGDACIYAEPHEVSEIVHRLYADRTAYREQAERGHTFIRENFGHRVHRQRVKALIGKPSRRSRGLARRSAPRKTIISFTANGEGMGHLTRQMAIAQRLPKNVQPIFVTLSLAMRVVREAGYLCEYIPQAKGARWTQFLARRLVEIIDQYSPELLVFDGTWPFGGLMQAREATSLPYVWIRRPMWQRGKGEDNMLPADDFHLIIEPGEFAEAYDQGLTVQRRDEAVRVPPILLLDQSELLPPSEARAELGLSASKQAVLVQLGSGNTYEVGSAGRTIAERFLRLRNTEVVFVDWMISRERMELPPGVKRVSTYPLGRYLKAFDFAVSAAGYNSYHELIGFGVPTIFVPSEKQLDDQHGRVRYAKDVGVALSLDPFTESGLEECLEVMLDDDRRRSMTDRCRELFPGNGAADAAGAIGDLVAHVPADEGLR